MEVPLQTFGIDPIMHSTEKKAIRAHAFTDRFSFDFIYHEIVNFRSTAFRDALLFYIDILSV